MTAAMIGLPEAAATERWKSDVVHQERLRVVHRRKQVGDLLGHRGDSFRRRALRRHPGRADLEQLPRLVHLVPREAVERREESERGASELRRARRNIGAGAVPGDDDAHGRQRAKPRANRRPAHADLHRQITFGRQPASWLQFSADDERADVGDHLIGGAFARFGGLLARVGTARTSPELDTPLARGCTFFRPLVKEASRPRWREILVFTPMFADLAGDGWLRGKSTDRWRGREDCPNGLPGCRPSGYRSAGAFGGKLTVTDITTF